MKIGFAGRTRGQSEVAGYALLVGFITFATVGVVAVGAPMFEQSEQQIEDVQMKQEMERLDRGIEQVAFSPADQRTVSMQATGQRQLTTTEGGWLRVSLVNTTTDTVEKTVVNQSLGTLEYRRDDVTFAHEAGGVWRREGTNVQAVSSPRLSRTRNSMTVPLVVVEGTVSSSGTVRVEEAAAPERVYVDPNPVTSHKLVVTVRSDYYEAWADYFRESGPGRVSVDDANETVTLELVSSPDRTPVAAGVVGTATNATLGTAGNGARVDSYNSADGPYDAAAAGDNGDVVVGGDVTVTGTTSIEGDVRADGAVRLKSANADVGNVSYVTKFDANEHATHGNVTRVSGVDTPEAIGSFVRSRIETVRTANDNDDTEAIQDATLQFTGGSATLDAGTYYLDNLSMRGESLTLDTSDGDVTLVVGGRVSLEKQGNTDATLSVSGDGRASVYVGGDGENDEKSEPNGESSADLYVGKGADVSVPGDDASRLWFYGDEDLATKIRGNGGDPTEVDGVIYAPAGQTGDGSFSVKHGDLNGAVVTGNPSVEQGGAVHYDEALGAVQPMPDGVKTPRDTFVHVTIYRVELAG